MDQPRAAGSRAGFLIPAMFVLAALVACGRSTDDASSPAATTAPVPSAAPAPERLVITCGTPGVQLSHDEVELGAAGILIAIEATEAGIPVVLRPQVDGVGSAEGRVVLETETGRTDQEPLAVAPGPWGAACIELFEGESLSEQVLERAEATGSFRLFEVTDPLDHWPALRDGQS